MDNMYCVYNTFLFRMSYLNVPGIRGGDSKVFTGQGLGRHVRSVRRLVAHIFIIITQV